VNIFLVVTVSLVPPAAAKNETLKKTIFYKERGFKPFFSTEALSGIKYLANL
jgi:hypothetical protein